MVSRRIPNIASRRGFSLIEVIMVCVIVGVVAAFALPKISLTQMRMNSQLQGLSTTLSASQRLAVIKQYDIIVIFDSLKNAIRIADDVNSDGVIGSTERYRMLPLGDDIVFGIGSAPQGPIPGSGIGFTQRRNNMPALTFHRNGSASESVGVYVTSKRDFNLHNRPNDARAIEIVRASGRANWYHYVSGTGWVRGF